MLLSALSSGEESGKFRINLSTIVCGDLSVAVALHRMNGEIFCFLTSSSAIASDGGVRDSVVVGVYMVIDDGFLCGGFGTDEYVMVVLLCMAE
jgi:hypothetical protein